MESSSLIFTGNRSRISVVSSLFTLALGLGTVAVTVFVLFTVFKGWDSMGARRQPGALDPLLVKVPKLPASRRSNESSHDSTGHTPGWISVLLSDFNGTSLAEDGITSDGGIPQPTTPSSDQLKSASSYSALRSSAKDNPEESDRVVFTVTLYTFDGSAREPESSEKSAHVSDNQETGSSDLLPFTKHSSSVTLRQTAFASDHDTGDASSDLNGHTEGVHVINNELATEDASTVDKEEYEVDSAVGASTKLSDESDDQESGLRDSMSSDMPSDAKRSSEAEIGQTEAVSMPSTDYDYDEFDDEEGGRSEPTVPEETRTIKTEGTSNTEDDSEEEEELQGFDAGESAQATGLKETASSSSTQAEFEDDLESLINAVVSTHGASHETEKFKGGVHSIQESSASDRAHTKEPKLTTYMKDDDAETDARDNSGGSRAQMRGLYATDGEILPRTQGGFEVDSRQSDSILSRNTGEAPEEFDGNAQTRQEPSNDEKARETLAVNAVHNRDDTMGKELQDFTTDGEIQEGGFPEASNGADSYADDANEAGGLHNTYIKQDMLHEGTSVSVTRAGARFPGFPAVVRDAPSRTKKVGEVASRPTDGTFLRKRPFVSPISNGGAQNDSRIDIIEVAHSAVASTTMSRKDGEPILEAVSGTPGSTERTREIEALQLTTSVVHSDELSAKTGEPKPTQGVSGIGRHADSPAHLASETTHAKAHAIERRNKKNITHNKRNMSLSQGTALERDVHVLSIAARRLPKVAPPETVATTSKPQLRTKRALLETAAIASKIQRRIRRREPRKATMSLKDSNRRKKSKTAEFSHDSLQVTRNLATVRNARPDVAHDEVTAVRSVYIDAKERRLTAAQNVHSNVTHSSTLRDVKASTSNAKILANIRETRPSDHDHLLTLPVALKASKELPSTTHF